MAIKLTSKEQQWQHLANRYAHVTDDLGKGIDAGILETVIVLNALGMRTTGSCEGHLEGGSLWPWVDIAANIALSETEQAVQALQAAQKQEDLHLLPLEEIDRLFEHARDLNQHIVNKHLTLRKHVLGYLASFYQNRHVPYDRQLTVHGLVVPGGIEEMRLESQGAGLLLLESDIVRAQKLAEYQAEIHNFTLFLKQIFLTD